MAQLGACCLTYDFRTWTVRCSADDRPTRGTPRACSATAAHPLSASLSQNTSVLSPLRQFGSYREGLHGRGDRRRIFLLKLLAHHPQHHLRQLTFGHHVGSPGIHLGSSGFVPV